METFNNKETNYRNYLENKNVIIVGPAGHVNSGKFIDGFDVVVRLNKGIDLCKKEHHKYGSKTNILYISEYTSYDRLNKNDIDKLNFIKLQFPDVDNKEYIHPISRTVNDKNTSMSLNNKVLRTNKEYLDFEKEIETRPDCGMTAIWDLLRYPIKSLYITGITLNTTNYSKNYISKQILTNGNKRMGAHNLKNIANYCKKNVITNDKVSYDDEFKVALEYF
jgi:hypothetical protein